MSMINPPIGELLSKVDCRYTLAVEASMRARQLIAGNQPLVTPKDTKPLVIAGCKNVEKDTALFSAIALPDPDNSNLRDRIMLEGEIPSPINSPAGCKFCTRCRYAQEKCKTERPEMREVAPGHFCACHFPLLDNLPK